MYALRDLGWTDSHTTDFEPHAVEGFLPARVAAQHRGAYILFTELGELRAEASGRLEHEADADGMPAVGDWVAIAARPDEGAATIHAVFPRRTKFSRKVAGNASAEQVLAANVDTVFLLMSLNEDFNLRRPRAVHHDGVGERREARDRPDEDRPASRVRIACARGRGDRLRRSRARDFEPDGRRARARSHAPRAGTDDRFARLLRRRQVDAREHARRRGAPRDAADPRGRRRGPAYDHPPAARAPARRRTRARLAGDARTPALGVVRRALGDVRGRRGPRRPVPLLGLRSRTEPGCAVQAALADGTLAAERWTSYDKLQRELAHLERRLDKRLQAEAKKRWVKAGAEGRANMRAKGRH